MKPTEPPVVLVTGCSTGIGRATVEHLDRKGCRVVATARNVDAIAELEGERVACARLDVSVDADRERVIRATLKRHGRIDALVNNAGYGAVMATEDTPLDVMRAMFETNLFGAHDLARRVLHPMRMQGHGRIVNVGSAAGLVPVPFMGAYCATKFALRALTQSLDMEVRQFGLRASLVEPGVITTGFSQRSRRETRAGVDLEATAYQAQYQRWAAARGRRRGRGPDMVAKAITHAVMARRPRNHYLIPIRDAKLANVAKRVLPDAWMMAIMRRYVL